MLQVATSFLLQTHRQIAHHLHVLFTIFQKLLCIKQAKLIGLFGLCPCLQPHYLEYPALRSLSKLLLQVKVLRSLNLTISKRPTQTVQSKEASLAVLRRITQEDHLSLFEVTFLLTRPSYPFVLFTPVFSKSSTGSGKYLSSELRKGENTFTVYSLI